MNQKTEKDETETNTGPKTSSIGFRFLAFFQKKKPEYFPFFLPVLSAYLVQVLVGFYRFFILIFRQIGM